MRLAGNISFENVSLEIKNRDSLKTHTYLNIKSIKVEDLGYGQLVFNNTIAVDGLVLKEPALKYYPYKYLRSEKAKTKGVVNLLKTIKIEKLDIQKGSFSMFQNVNDSLQLKVSSYDFQLFNGTTGPELVTEKIPIKYDSYELKTDSIYVDLGEFETLTAKEFTTTDTELEVKEVHLKSKYGKRELSKHLTVEHDYVDLQIPMVTLRNLDFGFTESRFGITLDTLKINKPQVEIYRDKSLPENLKPKRMYSEVLRKLPMSLVVGDVIISDGNLSYEEKLKPGIKAGILTLEQFGANLKNITNAKDAEETEIEMETKVMGRASLKLAMDFNVNSPSDEFNASGSLTNLKANQMNVFLEPNLRVRTKGDVEEMYFTFNGNSVESKGTMRMKYEDFKFDVLKKDRLKINKLLTAVGNIFINDGSKSDAKGFRHGIIKVERKKDKSLFNYLWINIQDGMLSTLSGSGEKKKRKN